MAENAKGFKKQISAQELINELYMQLREHEERLKGLSSNIQLLQLQYEEVKRALETVKSLENLDAGHDILVPLGAGVYGSFKSVELKNLTVGVGSRVYLEKTPVDTANLLQDRLEKSEDLITKLQEEMERVAQRHQALSQQFQAIVQRVQEARTQAQKPSA